MPRMASAASQTAPEVTVNVTQRPQHGEIRIAKGVEYIFDACLRCSGTGYTVYTHVDGGTCFDCRYYDTKLRCLVGAGGRWVEKKVSDRRAKARARYAATREIREAKKAAKIAQAVEALVEIHPLLAELTYFSADGIAGHSTFLADLGDRLRTKGTLSERQIATAERIIGEEISKQAKKDEVAAAKRAAKVELTPVPEGRIVLKGVVDGFYTQRTEIYRGKSVTTDKMWVVDPEGHRVSVSVPAGLEFVETGSQVQLTVTIKRDKREVHKGWGTRPAKAVVLS